MVHLTYIRWNPQRLRMPSSSECKAFVGGNKGHQRLQEVSSDL